MIVQSKISRRQWLRGAGGVVVGLPFLQSLWPRAARAQMTSPRRFVFVGSRWGRDMDRGIYHYNGERRCPWYPLDEPAGMQEGVAVTPLADIHSGPEGHMSAVFSEAWDSIRDRFTLIRGLDGMHISGDAHGTTLAMTGSGSLPGGHVGFGYSIDAVMAESSKFYPTAPYIDAIRTAVGPSMPTSFSYSSRTGLPVKLGSDRSPSFVYERLFHPEALVRRDAYASRQVPVLNSVMDEYRELVKPGKLSSEDHYKLQAHLDLISGIEKSLGISLPSCAVGEPLQLEEVRSSEELHNITMDLEIAALACGATNIVSHVIIHHDSEVTPNRGEAHSAAHGGRSRPEESGRAAKPQWLNDKWVMARVADFIKKLDAVRDGEGSLLDSTVLLYGNWEARGFHSFYDMPVVVAGSPDILKMGYFLDYRPRPLLMHHRWDLYVGRPYNALLVSLLQAVGLEPSDYQRLGRPGFGVYDDFDPELADHYRPFLSDPNAVLPLLLNKA